jgi:hypothetical protein
LDGRRRRSREGERRCAEQVEEADGGDRRTEVEDARTRTRRRGRRAGGRESRIKLFFLLSFFLGVEIRTSTVHAWLCWACCVCLAGVHGWAAGATMPLGGASSPCTLSVTCDLRRPRTTSQASTTPSTSKVPLRSILSPATNGDHGNRDPAGL